MGDITITYAAASTMTWTPASVASSTYDGSLANSNSNSYVDALVGGIVTTGTSPTADTLIQILAYGSWDGGTTYSAGMSGSDGGTPDTGEENQLRFVEAIKVTAVSSTTYEWGPVSMAQVFGGVLPEYWGLCLYNDSGEALGGTAGEFVTKFQGIKYNAA